MNFPNCKHPDHNNKETCEDRTIGCAANCICCMGELARKSRAIKTVGELREFLKDSPDNAELICDLYDPFEFDEETRFFKSEGIVYIELPNYSGLIK